MGIISKSVFEKVNNEDGFRICIMRFIKSYYKYDLWLRDLAPSIELLNDWKDKKISWEEYEKRYLEKIKHKKVIKELLNLVREKKVVTLLCCEKRR